MDIKTYNFKKSIKRAGLKKSKKANWEIATSSGTVTWANNMERIAIIRNGLPFDVVETLGQKANLPTKAVLNYLGLAQTTYNKKKRENDLLSRRESEVVLILSELLDFGLEVFNNEAEKFQRWLKKPNMSLGNVAPESLFDSLSGIQEVRNALNRLEYGNMT